MSQELTFLDRHIGLSQDEQIYMPDTRPVKNSFGITVDDIAKRLIDYGFHARTTNWPLAGILMVEHTESESLAEFDRFCDGMISIRSEIKKIESGQISVENSLLRHAPFTVESVAQEEWKYEFKRSDAAFPTYSLRPNRYWPPVARIDNVHRDRNLMCGCPPLEAYGEKPMEVE